MGQPRRFWVAADVAPITSDFLPASQLSQEDAPSFGLYVPATQDTQVALVEAPTAVDILPFGHWRQLVDPGPVSEAYLPAVQSTHVAGSPAPFTALCLPAAHDTHTPWQAVPAHSDLDEIPLLVQRPPR